MKFRFGPDFPKETYVSHGYSEQTVDLGEIEMTYVRVAGRLPQHAGSGRPRTNRSGLWYQHGWIAKSEAGL